MFSYGSTKSYCVSVHVKWQKRVHSSSEISASFNIEIIEVDQEREDTRKYQTMNRFRKGFQHRLNACKNNSGKLIEGDS